MINSGIIIVDMTVTTLDRCKTRVKYCQLQTTLDKIIQYSYHVVFIFQEYRGAPTDNMTEL